MRKTKTGFTIIELLVVVAIIALIAATVIASMSTARAKSRDAKRIQNMQEINNALNLYHNQKNYYPNPYAAQQITGSDPFSVELKSAGVMPAVPADPLGGTTYLYKYTSANGSTFDLNFCLETNTIKGYTADCNNHIKP